MNKSLSKKIIVLLVMGIVFALVGSNVAFADALDDFTSIDLSTVTPTPSVNTSTPTPSTNTSTPTPTSASVVDKDSIAKAGSNSEIFYTAGLAVIGVVAIALFKKMNDTKIKSK